MSFQFPLSLDWLAENRPDLLPAVEIDGYPANGRHEEPEWADAVEYLPAAMVRLSAERQELINAIYFRGVSIRSYARSRGVDHAAVVRQLQRTLKTLRKLMEDERNAT